MGKEIVISKGKYSHEQPSDLMGVKQYLFIKDTDGRKRLLLRFCNYRKERCSKFGFILYRMDAKGRVIGKERYESAEREYYENEVFSFNRKIDVEERCTDFKVQIIYAVYGNYTYRVEDGEVAVSYSDKVPYSAGTAAKARPRKIFHRTFELPWLFAILSAIILAVGFTVMGILLMDFKENEDEFTLSGVTYRFIDNEVKDAVIITGCSSTYREIYISSEIEGHPVVGIEDGAFEKNKNIVSLTIDGINIPDEAFKKCAKLETLVIKNVTGIGKEAFSDCDRLESVVINEGEDTQILRIGSAAFGDCGALKSVEINQTVAYSSQVDIFNESYNIETLKLRNLAYTIKGIPSTYVERLNQLFGSDEVDESDSKLKTLVIDNIERIPANFAHGFEKLESFTVTNSSIKNIGNNAFKDCKMLSAFTANGKLTAIGSYAFAGTSITEIDLSNVTSLGEYAFMDAAKLASVVGFGNSGIDNVPRGAFYGCKSLTSFGIHTNVKFIYTEAFSGTGLKKFSIPQGVSYQAAILRNCQSLVELDLYELGAAGFVGQLFGAKASSSTSQITECIPSSLRVIHLTKSERISPNAFRGCASVATIELREEVVSIGDNAFENCKKLTEIDIPVDSQHLISIGSFAFAGCESLKTVPLPEKVQQIGVGALSGCNGLESLTLRFLGPTQGDDGGEEIVSYIFNGTLPVSLKSISFIDTSIVNLPSRAFDGCEYVEEISIPSTVTAIGENSFRGCKALVTLKYSDTASGGEGVVDLERITDIGKNAFYNCTSLSELKLNPNIESIGNNAFSYTALREFCVPEGVDEIGSGILSGCNQIVSFVAFRMGDRNGEKTISYFFDSVPASLKSVTVYEFKNNKITDGAFMGCSGVTEFNLPEEITVIGEDAFYGCSSLEYFDMSGIEVIENRAFRGCTALTECDLSGVTSIGMRAFYETGLVSVVISENTTSIASDTFNGCTSLTSVTLPQGLKSIGASAFENTAIESIDIPDTVTHVGNKAFAGAPLVSITVPAGVTSFGSDIFEGCDSLQSITFPMAERFYDTDGYGEYESVAHVLFNSEFPQSLKSITLNNAYNDYIYSYAFYGSNYVEEIILCNGIASVYSSVFADSPRLNYVSLPSTLNSIRDNAFENCIHLYEVSNPSGCNIYVENMIQETSSLDTRAPVAVSTNGYKFARYNGEWYLISCPVDSEATEISLDSSFSYDGESITEYNIPQYLFYGNSQLSSIKLASGIKEIGAYAFADCGSLETVTFPTALEVIAEGAFSGCNVLNGVKLYQNVRSIGNGAFFGCYVLYDVYCTSNYITPVAGEFGYGNVARNAVKIHTDMGAALSRREEVGNIGVFRTTGDAWLLLEGYGAEKLVLGQFKYEKTDVSSFRIAENAFAGQGEIRELVITDAVKQIQAGAFSACSNLVSVDCSGNSSLKIIENETFSNCSSLRFVTLPSTVKEIGDSAFYGCRSLESVDMPSALEIIGSEAFSGCSRLVSVVIGENVEAIGFDAFYGCNQLYEVYNLSDLEIRLYDSWEDESRYGYVSANAYAVFTSLSEGFERKDCDGAKLIKLPIGGVYKWYLYSFVDKGLGTVKVTGEGTEVVILATSFIGGKFDKLVLSKDISKISGSAFYDCNGYNIYYEGTESEWRSVDPYYSYSNVYFYEDCVHYNSNSNVWTYSENGDVTVDRCKENMTVTVAPTCYTGGVNTYKCACKGCTYVRTENVNPSAHEFENGVCKNCGGKEAYVDGTTLQSYVTGGQISINGFTYDAGKKSFASQNKGPESTSTFIITAKTDMTVSFTVSASCRENHDYVIVAVGDSVEEVTGTSTQTFYKILKAGQTLEISYQRGINYSTENDNCGYIKDMQIVEKAAEQSN